MVEVSILAASYGGTPYFDTLKFLSNFIFALYFLTLKISCVLLKRLKSLNFEGPFGRETPIVAPPIFGRFNFIFNIYLFRKFDPSSFNGLKVLTFGGPD